MQKVLKVKVKCKINKKKSAVFFQIYFFYFIVCDIMYMQNTMDGRGWLLDEKNEGAGEKFKRGKGKR